VGFRAGLEWWQRGKILHPTGSRTLDVQYEGDLFIKSRRVRY
jgi:hypothetical protein